MGDQYRRFRYFHSKPDSNQNEYTYDYPDLRSHIYTDPYTHANIHFYSDIYIYAGSIANIHTDTYGDEHIQCIGFDLC